MAWSPKRCEINITCLTALAAWLETYQGSQMQDEEWASRRLENRLPDAGLREAPSPQDASMQASDIDSRMRTSCLMTEIHRYVLWFIKRGNGYKNVSLSNEVKCTGERSGCERCQMLQTPCIYMESRVGKVAGVRARKRSLQQPLDAAQYIIDGERPELQQHQQAKATTVTSGSTLVDDGNDTISQWIQDSNDPGSDIDSLGSVRDPNHGSQDTTNADFLMPAMDFNLDDILRSPLGLNHFEVMSPPKDTSKEDEAKRLSELDSQCVLICCQIVTELESCKVANIQSLQIVLGIVKKAVERLIDIVRLQQESRSFKCMAMFGVLIYQIIELLECGCASFLNVDADHKNSLASQVHGMLPALSFGYLTMDPKEQSSWRCHIVLREIRQTSELLQNIKKLSGVGESGAADGVSTQLERERCFVDLENRLKALSDRVTSCE
ncbi:hypothetical protein BDV96DRAFT_593336 [Lophiotrema nucula]|uniref:Zn(2)-C6 fungal-type domain-containing protein n=1 Tax=Lophiotrema nucula TaxID=690887 RepID=A0A6A5ZVE4_9PLEO|nr:hypothetical protein BDV96DRAFT_593336 [Lophiotrema nucula]